MADLPEIALDELVARLNDDDGVGAHLVGENVPVRGMTIDSRTASKGCLFVCKGAGFRPEFLANARAAGAAAFLCQEGDAEALANQASGMPYIAATDVRRAMALVAPVLYGNPDVQLNVIGITGTKGKSTVAYMLRSIFAAADIDASILGSIDTDDGIERHESHNTTPEAPDLWRHLHNTVASGRRHMIMEVSSQGLKYDRVLGLKFDVACFLNIGRDHISPAEHPSFEDYFASKLRIFEQCETALVNLNSERIEDILAAAQAAPRLVTFAVEHDTGERNAEKSAGASDGHRADYNAAAIESTADGIAFDVIAEGQTHRMTLGMAGLFNVDNALAAIAMARLAGISFENISEGLSHVRVPGRMELITSADKRITAIVDYAHNTLSFETLFSSVRKEYPGRKVIAVFGAPGDKAQERREQLPQVAGRYADLIIYTEEDPGHERVEDICEELASHTPAGVPYEIVCNREAAVAHAFEEARGVSGALVLLLGKGDEVRQHRGDEYVTVKSDLHLARELMQK